MEAFNVHAFQVQTTMFFYPYVRLLFSHFYFSHFRTIAEHWPFLFTNLFKSAIRGQSFAARFTL